MAYNRDADVEEALVTDINNGYFTYDTLGYLQRSTMKIKSRTPSYTLQIAGYIFGALYFLYLNLKLEDRLLHTSRWTHSNVLLILFLGAFTAHIHQSIHNPRQQMKNSGQIVIMILVCSTDVLLLAFNLLATLQADGLISMRYLLMFIPLLLLSVVLYFYICFIMPGFLDNESRLYKEAFLLTCYYTAALTTVIFLTLKLDNLIIWKYTVVFSPVYSAFGLHGLYIFAEQLSKKVRTDLQEVFVLTLSVVFLTLAATKADSVKQNKQNLSWFAVLTPIYLLFVAGVVRSLAKMFIKKRRELTL